MGAAGVATLLVRQRPEAPPPVTLHDDLQPILDVLRSAVSMLAYYDKETEDISVEATQRKALRLVAQFPTVIAAIHRAPREVSTVVPNTSTATAASTPAASPPMAPINTAATE